MPKSSRGGEGRSAVLTAEDLDLVPSALSPGIYYDYPEALYHSAELGVASQTGLKILGRSPLHFKTWVEARGREETDSLRIGRAVHCLLLEPRRFKREYAIMPKDLGDPGTGHFRTKEAKARRDAWLAERGGAPVLDESECRQVRGMCESVLAHPKARMLLEESLSEVTLRWTDAITGVKCKARLDSYSPELDAIVDLKSCEDAGEASFIRSVERYRYHHQNGFYVTALCTLEQREEASSFAFIPVEKSPPYACAVYELDAAAVDLARETIAARLELLAECLAKNAWPGPSQEIRRLSLPPWAKD
jgi:hypothetical protein